MKKFEFKLNAVHKVREITKDRESNALSVAQAETSAVSERLSEIEDSRQRAAENLSEKMRGGSTLDPAELEIQAAYLAALARQTHDTKQELEQKRDEVQRKVESVTAALRDVKVTEKLRDTEQQRHAREAIRQEQAAVDEIVTTSYSRKMTQVR